MIINGTVYSFPLLAGISFFAMFGGQYVLLRFVRLRWLRYLPWVWGVGMMVLAAAIILDGTTWMRLRVLIALMVLGYAAVCAAGIGAAHLLNRYKKR